MLMKNVVILETRNDEHECQLNISAGCPADFVLNSLEKFKEQINKLIEEGKPKDNSEVKDMP